MRLRHTITVVAAAAAAAASLSAANAASAASGSERRSVANAQPDVSGAAPITVADPRERTEVRLYLADRNGSELDARVRAVSDPRSPLYRQYLTPARFRARYAPGAATITAVRRFLTGYGLTVTEVPDNGAYVAAEGTVAQVQSAFATNLHVYRLRGRTLRAAATRATLPAALTGQVIAVSGLASISELMTPRHEDGRKISARQVRPRTAGLAAPPPDAFVNPPPCSTFYGQRRATTLPPAYGSVQPYVPCGYGATQLQGAYGLETAGRGGSAGRGVRVAITDAYAAPTILQDANTYAGLHGQPAVTAGQFRQVRPARPFRKGYDDTVNGDTCGEQGWYGEETLDVEAVHAVAPGAGITYVASRSCDNTDFAVTLNRVVDRHLADIVTNSWGNTGESNGSAHLDAVYRQIFSQAALQGIGVYFSSGDDGDGSTANNGIPTAESPANSPLVTAVGGTSLAVDRANHRLFETGWSTGKSVLGSGVWAPRPPGDFLYGAGGGTSQVFLEPWYQQDVVPARLAKRYSAQGGRVVPDVAAVGDPNTGMLIGETQTFPDGGARYSEYRIGGTSVSSPIFAGIMAIADQVSGRPHGFANPALYAVAGGPSYYDPQAVSGRALARVDYVNKVDDSAGTVTSLRSLDVTVGTILRTRPGYDDITGLGTPNGPAFLSSLRFPR